MLSTISVHVKRLLKFVLSLLLTAVLGWWAFRDTNWQEQWQSLRSANYWWLIPYFSILLVIHLCRTLRWGSLLSGMERVRFRQLNEAAGIGFMMLLLLPLRLGEFARPFLIGQRSSIRRSAAMTSVVMERIIDGMSIAVLLRVLLFFVSEESEEVRFARWGANLMFAVFGGGLAFLLFALWHQRQAVSLVRATIGRLSPRMAERAAHVVDTFVGALRHIPRGGQMAGFALFTVAYWGLNGIGMYVLSRAFDCSRVTSGCVPMQLSLFQTYVVLCVLVVGLMIPGAPGMIGTFQAAVKLGLSLFLPPAVLNGTGVAYANVAWLCQTVQQVGLGLVLMSLGNVSFREVAGKLGQEGEPPATSAVV
jgi:uncharacterized membrane protein YbhN (UPF0104 family)